MKLNEIINIDHVIKWRQYLHQNPELSFHEDNTAQYIRGVLTSFKVLDIINPTKTSVVAVLDTKVPGPTIALRADIDALAMQERLDVDYKSKNDGIAHTCGHDTHTAMLLGACEALVSISDQLKGKIKFVFQHAEEVLPGGAQEIIATGILDDIDEIYGLHVITGVPVGMIKSKPGPITASSDTFKINLYGKGTHGAQPDKGIDLAVVCAEFINNIQTIVARNVVSTTPAVVTIAQINIGTTANIIADSGYIAGTIRNVDQKTREFIHKRFKDILEHTMKMHDVNYDLELILGYSPVVVDMHCFEVAKKAAIDIVGDHNFEEMKYALMNSEDFSAYTNIKKGCYSIIGGGMNPNNHHPEFFIDEEALLIGTKLHVQTIYNILHK